MRSNSSPSSQLRFGLSFLLALWAAIPLAAAGRGRSVMFGTGEEGNGAVDEVHWTFTGPDSVTFDWRGGDGAIRYGLTSDYDLFATGLAPDPYPISSAGPFWEARLTGLAPAALYHYSIGDGPDGIFTTPPAPGSGAAFTVAVEADIGDALIYPRAGAIQAGIAEVRPDFVLVPGDLTYANGHGQGAVDRHFNDVMVWSRAAAYMPAWGNHEWDVPDQDDLRNYKGRFDFPNPQTSPGSPAVSCCGEDWYWFDYGSVRFIAYPEPWLGAWQDWKFAAAGLMDEAEADPSIEYVVTFGHRPAYSSGHHPGAAKLRQIMDALGASHPKYVLNLNGHSHNYERTLPQNGVVHITSGNGGGPLETDSSDGCLWLGGCPAPDWTAFRAMHHGFLLLRFEAGAITGTEICGPAGDDRANRNDINCDEGSVIDRFTIGDGEFDRAPVVGAPATVSGAEGEPITVEVEAFDPDGDPIEQLSADLSALPEGSNATFIPEDGNGHGRLSWTPSFRDAGSYTVTFTASNALPAAASTVLTVAPTNRPPVASLIVTPEQGEGPLAVVADASASFDPDDRIASYWFDFGDGTYAGPQEDPLAPHTFAPGAWTVVVTVLDAQGAMGRSSAVVAVLDANLVENGSFEDSTSGWREKGAQGIGRAEGGLDGSWSMTVRGPDQPVNFGVNDSPNWVRSVPAAGTHYRFEAWARSASSTGSVELRIREYLGQISLAGTVYSPPVALSPQWQLITVDVTARAEGSTLDFQIFDRPSGAGESFQLDRISVRIVPPDGMQTRPHVTRLRGRGTNRSGPGEDSARDRASAARTGARARRSYRRPPRAPRP